MTTPLPSQDTERDLVLSLVLDAPRDEVYRCWTEPDLIVQWFAPKPWSTPRAVVDVRPGGASVITMADEQGNLILPAAQGMNASGYPTTTEVTVVLEALNGRTKMVMTHSGMAANAEGASAGWEQSFGKLAAYVETLLDAR